MLYLKSLRDVSLAPSLVAPLLPRSLSLCHPERSAPGVSAAEGPALPDAISQISADVSLVPSLPRSPPPSFPSSLAPSFPSSLAPSFPHSLFFCQAPPLQNTPHP